jgi:CubicO group peptidase (beta-lactamase class C family)
MSAVAAGVIAGSARAQVDPVTAARIDKVFKRFTHDTPGCALLVRKDGATLYSHSYGLASLDLDTPIGEQTVFNTASASKQFTSASVLLLARDGKVSLDDDIRRYVPELPDLGAHVTLRQLLTHTSGWRDYIQLLVWQGHEVRDHVTERDALNILQRQRALNFAPGTEFRYSNTGYFLLSLVIQRVSGIPLAEFARRRIFEPLGMHDTRYVTDMRDVIKKGATGYEPVPGGQWREAMSGWELTGAGGVYTTVGDLAKWDDNFTSGLVGGTSLGDSLSAVEHLASGVPIPYGLGLFTDQYAGQRRVWHNGIWAGYRAVLMRFPDAKYTIISLCNAADVVSESMADAVADVVLPPRPVVSHASTTRAVVPDADQVAGTYYSNSTNQRVAIVVDSGGVALAGAPLLPLSPVGPRQFRLPTGTTVLRFEPASGVTQTMYSQTDGRVSVYSRVLASLPVSSFGQYAGRYRSEELGVEWTIVVTDAGISLRDERGELTPLHPIFRDGFAGPGTVRFERDRDGAVTGLTMTTTGVYLLRFPRK